MIANQVRRAATRAGGGGGPGYPASTVLAYEFDDLLDAINGYVLSPGATMSLSGGELHSSNTDAATDQATTTDTTIYDNSGTMHWSVELYCKIVTGGSIPALVTLKSNRSINGFSVFASSLAGYMQFTIGFSGSTFKFNSAVPYVAGAVYHLVLSVDYTLASSLWYTLYINDVQYASSVGSGLGAVPNANSIGWNVGTANGAVDYRHFRKSNITLSPAQAHQLYLDRDIHP